MGGFSVWHWIIVLLVVVLIFGTKKLRNIGSDLGGAVKSFKEGMREENEAQSEAQNASNQEDLKINSSSAKSVDEASKPVDVEVKEKR